MQSTGTMDTVHYWVIVASKDHLQRGVTAEFIQADQWQRCPVEAYACGRLGDRLFPGIRI